MQMKKKKLLSKTEGSICTKGFWNFNQFIFIIHTIYEHIHIINTRFIMDQVVKEMVRFYLLSPSPQKEFTSDLPTRKKELPQL